MMPTTPAHPDQDPRLSPRPRRRSPVLLVAVIVAALLLVVGGGVAAASRVLGSGDAASDTDQPRRTTAELARKGLNCNQPKPVTESVEPAQERLSCATGGGSTAIVSTFANGKTARADAEQAQKRLEDEGKWEGAAILVGPYWTVSCTMLVVCESAQGYLDGDLRS